MDLKNISVDLYLIRHADSASLPNHWTDLNAPLSALGIEQAQNVTQRLKNRSLDVLITSPLTRAKQTAEIIHKECQSDLRLQVQAWLAEIDLGDLGGVHKSVVRKQFPKLPIIPPKDPRFPAPLVARLLTQNKEFTFPYGESLREFWERVSKGFSLIMRQYTSTTGKKIGLVGHGGSFTVIVLTLLGKTLLDNKFPVFFFNKGDFTFIRIVNGQILFLQVNPALIPENKPK
ncbi:MAG: histidine phosphatase family protein [Candidatus Hodarchaeota archaeon]